VLLSSSTTLNLKLLDEKSVAPGLSKVIQVYHRDALAELHKDLPRDKDDTCLVLTMLKQEEVSVKKYYQQCEQKGRIPLEWCTFLKQDKDLELKIDPRVFTKLHPNVRHMASVSEAGS